MKTTTHRSKHFNNAKNSEDYYLILQLYNISKKKVSKSIPALPLNDSRRNFTKTSLKAKDAGFKKFFLQQLHVMMAPVFKRTAA